MSKEKIRKKFDAFVYKTKYPNNFVFVAMQTTPPRLSV